MAPVRHLAKRLEIELKRVLPEYLSMYWELVWRQLCEATSFAHLDMVLWFSWRALHVGPSRPRADPFHAVHSDGQRDAVAFPLGEVTWGELADQVASRIEASEIEGEDVDDGPPSEAEG